MEECLQYTKGYVVTIYICILYSMNTRQVRFVRLFRNNNVLVLSKITHCRIFKANSHRRLTKNKHV
jgi:hypothetical protein